MPASHAEERRALVGVVVVIASSPVNPIWRERSPNGAQDFPPQDLRAALSRSHAAADGASRH